MGVFGPRPVPPPFRIPVLVLQARRSGAWPSAQLGEGLRQLVQRAAQDAHVVRMPQFGCQSDLGWLVLQVAPQICATHAGANARLFWPKDVALDRAGNVLVADTQNHRIRRIAALTGVIETVGAAGSRGYSENRGLASVPALHGPTEIAVDGERDICLAERRSRRGLVRSDLVFQQFETDSIRQILETYGPIDVK